MKLFTYESHFDPWLSHSAFESSRNAMGVFIYESINDIFYNWSDAGGIFVELIDHEFTAAFTDDGGECFEYKIAAEFGAIAKTIIQWEELKEQLDNKRREYECFYSGR